MRVYARERSVDRGPASRAGLASRTLIAAALVSAALLFSWLVYSQSSARDPARGLRGGPATDKLVLPGSIIFDPAVRPLAASDAQALNEARPVDVLRPVAANPFVLPDPTLESTGSAAALRCLSQAVYYEAGNQSDDGMRAVAQVVLNRVRHPAFPHTVCGVVYQGFARTTGCQFTFTCDGSLSREPSQAGWARARRAARAALAGHVYHGVGLATHYHADYVIPYWAASLAKVDRVGAHLFYQLPGRFGMIGAFNARYDRDGEAGAFPGIANTATIAGAVVADPVFTEADPASLYPPPLRSDVEAGELIPQLNAGRSGGTLLNADRTAGSLKGDQGSSLLVDEHHSAPQ